jgi:hypothetical protein
MFNLQSTLLTRFCEVMFSHWCIKVDEKTQFKISTFHKHKNGMVEPICELFFRWKQGENPVSFIRCDNAGENMTLQKRVNSVDWKLNITFEFTPRDTPQHNHLAELRLASIANKGRALMSAANVPLKIRYKVWEMAFHSSSVSAPLTCDPGRLRQQRDACSCCCNLKIRSPFKRMASGLDVFAFVAVLRAVA